MRASDVPSGQYTPEVEPVAIVSVTGTDAAGVAVHPAAASTASPDSSSTARRPGRHMMAEYTPAVCPRRLAPRTDHA